MQYIHHPLPVHQGRRGRDEAVLWFSLFAANFTQVKTNQGIMVNVNTRLMLTLILFSIAESVFAANIPEPVQAGEKKISRELRAAAAQKNPPVSRTSFGSEKILNSCWTKASLRGGPSDKRILFTRRKPDYSPPERLNPYYHLPPLQASLQGSIRSVRMPDPKKKLIALTFDLCERSIEKTGYDAEIVNYLRDNKIAATFFAGGKWMRDHPDKTRQLMADPLFEIGNHSWNHDNMQELTIDKVRAQVLWTQAQYELLRESLSKRLPQCGVPQTEINKIPPVPLSFRYPYGVCNRTSMEAMGALGLAAIQWNIVTADPWKKQTAEGIAQVIRQRIKPGSIIVAHANGRGLKTREALSKFIPDLIRKGFKFVTVTQLLAEGKEVEAVNSCYELKPGDNLRYRQAKKRNAK